MSIIRHQVKQITGKRLFIISLLAGALVGGLAVSASFVYQPFEILLSQLGPFVVFATIFGFLGSTRKDSTTSSILFLVSMCLV